MEQSEKKFTPPYGIAWRTFLNWLDKFGELEKQGLAPPRIDRSFLQGMSGNDQSYLMSTLRGFDLMGPAPENTVNPELVKLATASPKDRKTMVADLLRAHYSEALELAEAKETSAKLEEVFRAHGVTGNTMRKAITWFMHAAQYADLPLSPHWNPPKPARGGVAPGSRRGTRRRKPQDEPPPADPSPTGAEQPAHTVELPSGGSVRLSYSVNLFTASTEERDFILGLIDSMKGFESKASKRSPRRSTKQLAPADPQPEPESVATETEDEGSGE